jgi:hypothetical protein
MICGGKNPPQALLQAHYENAKAVLADISYNESN